MGPVFQHPLKLGADLVLYSATKYLSGFSDLVAGAAISNDPALIERMRSRRTMFGNILQPDECWMLDGRLPTVSLRMNRQSKNAQRIAEKLDGRPAIRRVIYPTLFTRSRRNCVFTRNSASIPAASFHWISMAGRRRRSASCGNSKSPGTRSRWAEWKRSPVIPRTTTHSGESPEELDRAGVTDGLVRVSVGIEDWRDLLADFEQALNAIE